MNAELLKLADNVHAMYECYRIVGFDEDKAFRLASDFATALLTVSFKAQAGDKLHGIYGNPDNRLRGAEGHGSYQLVVVARFHSGAGRRSLLPTRTAHGADYGHRRCKENEVVMAAVSVTITIETPDGSTVDISPGPTRSAETRQADPWSDGDTTTSDRGGNASASRSGASEGNSARPSSGVVTDDRGKQWSFNAAGSPACQCGNPAALVNGKTNGKSWSQWRCAKAYDDWKHKCDFAQWV